jgi:hypothetical protein
MPDVVEAAGNIRIERPFTRTGGSQQSVKGDDRVHRAPSGPEPIAVRLETCLPFGFQRHLDEHLQGPVTDRRHIPTELHSNPSSLWDRLRLPIPSIPFAGAGSLS